MLIMRLLFATCFSANLLALMVTGSHISTSAPNTCDSMMKCTAIKMLEKKLEDLIALVNKTSNCTCTPKPSPPTPPGKLGQSLLTDFLLLIFCCGEGFQNNI